MVRHRGSSPAYRFRRIGRFPHYVIDGAAAIARLPGLDAAHWVTLSAPTADMHADRTFLSFVDGGGEGRITHADLTAAVSWYCSVFREHSGLEAGSAELHDSAIDAGSADGAKILCVLQGIRERNGLSVNAPVPYDLVREIREKGASAPTVAAGSVLPEAAPESVVQDLIKCAIAVTGGVPHPGGGAGIDSETLTSFVETAQAYVNWKEAASDDAFPLGPETPALYARHRELFDKIDQYFALCSAAALDERVRRHRYFDDETLSRLSDLPAAELADRLRAAPLAVPDPCGVFRFDRCVNRYYARELKSLDESVLQPLAGEVHGELDSAQWSDVRDALSRYERRLAARPKAADVLVGFEPVERFLTPGTVNAVRGLIDGARAGALVSDDVALTERAALYQAHLLELANNFVSFPYLYDRTARAVFEMGTLIMDGRYFNFAVRVEDRAKHAAVAANANMFVMYLTVREQPERVAYEVAVPVTSGGKGNIAVGKRGVFIDRSGAERDAEVVHIIENPISVGEAVVAPFRRLGQLITGKIETMRTAARSELDVVAAGDAAAIAARGGSHVTTRGDQSQGRMTPGSRAGLLVGGGVAVAAVGSAVAYITNTLAALRWYQVLIGIGSAVFAVILPATVLALIKLRRRDMSALLEGCGWAVNGRLRLTRSLTRFFTRRPSYPRRSRGVRRFSRRAVFICLGVIAVAAAVWWVLTAV